MMERHIRNQAIVEAYEAGEHVSELALRFNLNPASIKRIVHEMKPFTRLRGERLLSPGISLLSAVTIEQALGIWPASDNIEEIESRTMDLLRSGTRGRHVKIAIAEVARLRNHASLGAE